MELGPDIANLTQHWSGIEPITVSTNFANYLVTQTVDGATRGHILTFVKEGNRWVLEEL